uniref:Uncharacterized protein n=1 Tax=Lepeophtheirus salmonis TaxID=72036 RepID=A0A0K2V740_LEPSM
MRNPTFLAASNDRLRRTRKKRRIIIVSTWTVQGTVKNDLKLNIV